MEDALRISQKLGQTRSFPAVVCVETGTPKDLSVVSCRFPFQTPRNRILTLPKNGKNAKGREKNRLRFEGQTPSEVRRRTTSWSSGSTATFAAWRRGAEAEALRSPRKRVAVIVKTVLGSHFAW